MNNETTSPSIFLDLIAFCATEIAEQVLLGKDANVPNS